MIKKLILFFLLSFGITGAESRVSKYNASIKEYGDETRKALRALEETAGFSLSIGQEIDQSTFSKICSDLSWAEELRTDYGNKNINSLAPISKLSKLKKLTLTNLQASEETPLNLEPLSSLTELEELDLYATKVTNTQALAPLTKLKKIKFYMSEVSDISFLTKTPNVQELDLYGFGHTFPDYSPLKSLQQLKVLNTYMNKQADNDKLAVLSNLNSLKEYKSSNNKLITHVDFLKPHTKLESVQLRWCRKLKNMDGLKNCNELKDLDITDSLVSNLDFLNSKKLTSLDIGGTKISDLSALKNCPNLNTLEISKTAIEDLSPIENCKELRSLDISKTKVKDLTPLHELKNLNYIKYSITIPRDEIEILKKLLPKCRFKINN